MELNSQEIINQYLSSKLTIQYFADLYKVPRHLITKILKENNIKIDTTRSGCDPYLNFNFFENIDSEEKAYFLGFLYADGHISPNINAIWINLHERDREILEKFKKLLNINKELYFIKGGPCEFKNREKIYYRSNQFKLQVNDKKIHSDLKKHGLYNNKSFTVKFPDLKENLQKHFIRGFFDGDGSIYKSKRGSYGFDISAPFNFNKSIQEFFLKYNISIPIFNINKYTKEFSSLKTSGNKGVLKIMDILYKDSTIFLKRKHEKYLDLKLEESKKIIHLPKIPFTTWDLTKSINKSYSTALNIINKAIKRNEIKLLDYYVENNNRNKVKRYIIK